MITVTNCILLQLTLHFTFLIGYLIDSDRGRPLQFYHPDNSDVYNYYQRDNNVIEFDNDSGDADDDDDNDEEEDVRPVFLSTEKNVTVTPGEKAVLRCHIKHLADRTVTWRRMGNIHPISIGTFTFISDPRISIEPIEHASNDSSEWNLRLQNVTPFDDGTYQCQVNTKYDQQNFFSVNLHVTIIQVTGTESVERGGSIQLLCNATGRPDPPQNVEWYKDDQMIESDVEDGIIITKKIETKLLVSVLVIKRSKVTDAGEYHCRSSDQDVGKISVNVQNVPVEKRGTSAAKIMSGNTSSKKIVRFWCCWSIAFLITLLLR